MGKGKFNKGNKPTGQRTFSTPDEIDAAMSKLCNSKDGAEDEESEIAKKAKFKGVEGLIEIENPNLARPTNVKAKDVDFGRTTELSRRESEELDKQKAHERHMQLQEQGKTTRAQKDLDRLAQVRQQRAEAAKKREEEKAAKELRKAETWK